MSQPAILAEDSLNEESNEDSCGGSGSLFSSPERLTLEEDYQGSPTVILPSPNNTLGQVRNVSRRLFTKPLQESNSNRPRVLPAAATCRELPVENSSGDTQHLILQEIKKTNSRLDVFATQLESLERRLASVESSHMSVTPSSSSGNDGSATKGKRKIPSRVSVRYFMNSYKCCCIFREISAWIVSY